MEAHLRHVRHMPSTFSHPTCVKSGTIPVNGVHDIDPKNTIWKVSCIPPLTIDDKLFTKLIIMKILKE